MSSSFGQVKFKWLHGNRQTAIHILSPVSSILILPTPRCLIADLVLNTPVQINKACLSSFPFRIQYPSQSLVLPYSRCLSGISTFSCANELNEQFTYCRRQSAAKTIVQYDSSPSPQYICHINCKLFFDVSHKA